MSAPTAQEPLFLARPPAVALRPYVSAYAGYRTEPGPRVVHQGVASGHLTFILCLEGAVEMLANADPSRPPGTFAAMLTASLRSLASIRK